MGSPQHHALARTCLLAGSWVLQGSGCWKAAFQGRWFPGPKKLGLKTRFLLARSLIFSVTVHPRSFPVGRRFMWCLGGCSHCCGASGSCLMEKSSRILGTEGERGTTSTGRALGCRCHCHSLIPAALGVSSGGFSVSASLPAPARQLLVPQDRSQQPATHRIDVGLSRQAVPPSLQ